MTNQTVEVEIFVKQTITIYYDPEKMKLTDCIDVYVKKEYMLASSQIIKGVAPK